ncbi:MAG: thioredoxin family protein [Candidatus Cloacimonadaceae bacterium]
MKICFRILLLSMFLLLSIALFAQTKGKTAKAKPKPLVTFIELGADSCIPCKMMRPVMEAVLKEYGDSISVVFYDVYKQREMGMRYNVRVMPTQVFLDKDGKEFFRHEGFYPKEEIIRLVDKKLGIKRKDNQPNKAEKQTNKKN